MMLWKQYVVPVTVLGLVQTNTTPVITTLAGELTNLNVRQYDLVTNGQVLGAVMVYDPALTAAEVSRAETETQLFGGRMDIAIDGRRQTIDPDGSSIGRRGHRRHRAIEGVTDGGAGRRRENFHTQKRVGVHSRRRLELRRPGHRRRARQAGFAWRRRIQIARRGGVRPELDDFRLEKERRTGRRVIFQ